MTKEQFQRKHLGDFTKFMGSEMGQDFMIYLQASRPKLGWYKDGLEQSEFMAKVASGHELCIAKINDALVIDRRPEEIEADYGVAGKDETLKDAKRA